MAIIASDLSELIKIWLTFDESFIFLGLLPLGQQFAHLVLGLLLVQGQMWLLLAGLWRLAGQDLDTIDHFLEFLTGLLQDFEVFGRVFEILNVS